jgi:hypothetical protein
MKYILIASFLFSYGISTFGQESIAIVVKDSSALKVNFQTILKLKKGQKLLIYKPNYVGNYWDAWSENGVYGSIDSADIKILKEESIWKMKTNTERLVQHCCASHNMEDFKVINFDLCSNCKKILKKDFSALREFFALIPVLDGALAEEHADFTWRFINCFNDDEFYSFLNNLSASEKKEIISYINNDYVSYPIIQNKQGYFAKYYPRSWQM